MLYDKSKMSTYEQEYRSQNISQIPPLLNMVATTVCPTTVTLNLSTQNKKPVTSMRFLRRPFFHRRLLFSSTVQRTHQQQQLKNLSVATIAASSILHRSSEKESAQRMKRAPSTVGSVQISPFLAIFVILSMALICSVSFTQAMPYGVVGSGVATINDELPNGVAQFSPFSSSMSNNAAALYLRFRKGVVPKETNDYVQPFIRFRKSLTETPKANDKFPTLMERRPPIDAETFNMESDVRRLFEYFIIAGLKENVQELAAIVQENGGHMAEHLAPITDICVIFPGLGETVPEGFERIETTTLGHPANLNHGSIRSHSAFLCYRRGYHKPPLMDLGILDEGRGEKLMTDATIIDRTPFGRSANVNNTSHGLYFTTRRAQSNGPPHQLVISHICVIFANKGEIPPHTYYKIDKNLNRGMVGSDVYVCYKKSQLGGRKIAYKPEVLDCFPKSENVNDSLAQNVPMFCLPMGAVIESWPERCREAEKLFSTCVLTDEKGTKYYGASLTFYEKYAKPLTDAQMELFESPSLHDDYQENYGSFKNGGDTDGSNTSENAVEEESEKTSFYCNKSICIVSRYPFFESFRRFLFFIYGVSISGAVKIPIERYISYLMYEVPFPSPSRPRVLVQLSSDMISFESHDDSQIPLSGATFVDSLKNLGAENFMYAMLLALLERKILVHSLRPWLLTSVSETICALMFPFHWQCPYIPQCPLALADVLNAPVPFIVGVDSRYFDLYKEPPSDVTCFDLDTATVSHSATRKSLKLNMLPRKPLKRLRASLELVLKQMTDEAKIVRSVPNGCMEQIQNCKENWEITIREAFLRFMCSLMSGYADFLRPITKSPRDMNATDTTALFDRAEFIRSRDANSLEFYKSFAETQCFNRFIEERSFVSDKNTYNVFFDDCIVKVREEKATKVEMHFLDSDASISNHTIVISAPEMRTADLENSTFKYDNFPETFNHTYFETDHIRKAVEANVRTSPIPTDYGKLKYWCVRTKQEINTSLSNAENFADENATCWSRTFLFYAYSLWFLQLPSMIQLSRNKLKILKLAFKVLSRMERSNIPFHDQVCYRTLIYLCGEYNKPELAVQVLLKMRRAGITMNAVTYGIYHWALMQGDWPTEARINAIHAWRRLRLRFEACMLWRKMCTSLDNSSIMDETPTSFSQNNFQHNGSINSTKSENNLSAISLSPSLSSLVHQVRKHALKGYDEVMQHGNSLLKKSGINSLVSEAKNLNKSFSRDISFSALSQATTINDGNNTTLLSTFDMQQLSACASDLFQLDSGSTGDILGAEFWMREIMPQNFTDICKMWLKSRADCFIDVAMSTATKCPNCETVVYDEHLISGWKVEKRSNLNTICPFCSHPFLPSLNVTFKETVGDLPASFYLPLAISVTDENSNGDEKADTVDFSDEKKLHNISVTFISPLLLRREIETLLLSNPLALADVSLRITHPVIFWNLLYYSRRLDIPTHILTWIAPHVHIRCVFDKTDIHVKDEVPMYFINHNDLLAEGCQLDNHIAELCVSLVKYLRDGNLFLILKHMISEHREKKETSVRLRRHFSIYRDIMFIALDKFGKYVDREQLDRQYQHELERLPPRIIPLLSEDDFPPAPTAIACRRIFVPLDVL